MCIYLGYRSKSNPYFGASVGRVCNRIGYGRFNLNGKHFEVDKNLNGLHQLHGNYVNSICLYFICNMKIGTEC